MIDFSLDRRVIGIDIGCAGGYLTQYLAYRLNGIMIGIDVSKLSLRKAKIKVHDEKPTRAILEFVCSDINHLPFARDSIDLIVCVSVLEHVNDLEGSLEEIKGSIKKTGTLIAGHPIETSLFKALLKLFWPSELRIRDPQIMGKEKFERSPDTHKHFFKTIRGLLQKKILNSAKEKIFFHNVA